VSAACRTHALEEWLSGALPPEEAGAAEAHVAGCAACAHTLAWLRLERSWMAQRARRMPTRPALQWEALEARLAGPPVAGSAVAVAPVTAPPEPVPGAPARHALAPRVRQARWAHGGAMALSAAAALLLVAFSLLLPAVRGGAEPVPAVATAPGGVEACMDTLGEAVAALERRVGACLVASPALVQR
jgi:anti-sigma factor RsiW